ncbi:hypothetical protein EW145_g3990 [Phellinidium pouzarii]|uniref:Uncharacterized protein n=1 Tax=Phellinidium pouzarii TaxID=167371 RepID=A0A4S4LA88_9AGAM|nr:hypothetical protein EW145_g3990 [Phellinidium pouzarii]
MDNSGTLFHATRKSPLEEWSYKLQADYNPIGRVVFALDLVDFSKAALAFLFVEYFINIRLIQAYTDTPQKGFNCNTWIKYATNYLVSDKFIEPEKSILDKSSLGDLLLTEIAEARSATNPDQPIYGTSCLIIRKWNLREYLHRKAEPDIM